MPHRHLVTPLPVAAPRPGRWAIALALLGGFGAWPAGLAAQRYAEADSLLAVQDTSGAIAVYERMVRRDRRDAEAHYRAGQLYMTRHPVGTDLSPNRRKAEEHFRYATRFAPDSAKYWIALADLFRGEDISTVRAQVRGLLNRARERAEAAGDGAREAEAAYRQARSDWNTFATFGRRYRHQEAGMTAAPPSRDADWKDIVQYFKERLVPIPGAGAEYLDAAEEALQIALKRRATFVDAAGLLVVVFGERERWEEAAGLTRRLIRDAPDSGRAWALHGLAMARTNRWRDAAVAFSTALDRMTADEAAPFRNLGQIMRRADELRFAQVGGAQRASFDSLYWRVAQPLALSETNEVQAEFYARIVYAQHRWSDPWRGYRGIETDMGTVFVRYGPPDVATSTSWLYEKPRFVFSFYLMPGFSRAHFAGESEWHFGQAQLESPARFDNIPIMRTLDTVLVQTARFRGPADSIAMMIVGAIPLRRMADSVAVRALPLRTGALIADSAGRTLEQDRRDETVTGIDAQELHYRSFRLTLQPGDYLLRVEAHLPSIDRAARGMAPVPVAAIPRDTLALSDVLLARSVTPRDSASTRWDEFLIEPNAGRFAPGDPVGLLWEIYNLTPDSTGTTRYQVQLWISVESIDRSGVGWLAALVGGLADKVGLTAAYDDRVSIDFTQEQPATPAAARVEHLTVELRDAPLGRYELQVLVRDLVTGQESQARRSFTIGKDPVTR
jgi:GWxTD domain-containing protein